jgi:hypothetical protein
VDIKFTVEGQTQGAETQEAGMNEHGKIQWGSGHVWPLKNLHLYNSNPF